MLDGLKSLQAESVQCVVTSPPYWGLRDYGVEGMIGLEPELDGWLDRLVEVFQEVRRVLRKDGTVWLNLGDAYNSHGGERDEHQATHKSTLQGGLKTQIAELRQRPSTKHFKPKDLLMMPARLAIALQADGWWLRSEIIWAKPNPMPESVTDRPTSSHEKIYLLTRSARYFYDADAVREKSEYPVGSREDKPRGSFNGKYDIDEFPGSFRAIRNHRNLRNVWTITTQPYPEAHFATFPEALVRPCIMAGTKPGDAVLDPFSGSATTGLVALKLSRRYIGIELNPDYQALAIKRIGPEAKQEKLFRCNLFK